MASTVSSNPATEAHIVHSLAPFADTHNQSRLLYLHAGGFDEDVKVETSVWYRDDAPSYRAISYTWGNPTQTTNITVDGRARLVHRNCAYALRQARLHHPGSYVWIDSICINQSDNSEKSAQVNKMYKVYKASKKVLACVGEEDESSEHIHDVLRDLRFHIPNLEKCAAPSNESPCPSSGFDRSDPDGALSHLARWHPHVTRNSVKRINDCYNVFSRRAYWERVWIVQELHAGRNRTKILCGKRILSWQRLDKLYRRLVNYRSHLRSSFFNYEVSHKIQDIRQILGRRKATNDFWALLSGPNRCADPRDRVYGNLELFDWEQAQLPRPVPDYNIPVWRLALEVAHWGRPKVSRGKIIDGPAIISLARALQLGDNPTTTMGGLIAEPQHPHHDTRGECSVFISRSCRLDANEDNKIYGNFMESSEHNESPARSPRLAFRRDFDLQNPLPVFMENRQAALVSPKTLPGDVLISDELLGCLILRPTDKVDVWLVVGRGIIMDEFYVPISAEAWYCECTKNSLGDESRSVDGVSVELSLSKRELLCLATAAASVEWRSGLPHSSLSIPVEDTQVKMTIKMRNGSFDRVRDGASRTGVWDTLKTCSRHGFSKNTHARPNKNLEELSRWLSSARALGSIVRR